MPTLGDRRAMKIPCVYVISNYFIYIKHLCAYLCDILKGLFKVDPSFAFPTKLVVDLWWCLEYKDRFTLWEKFSPCTLLGDFSPKHQFDFSFPFQNFTIEQQPIDVLLHLPKKTASYICFMFGTFSVIKIWSKKIILINSAHYMICKIF